MAAEIFCDHCSTPNPPTESFCENCGAELNAGPVQPPPSSAPTLLNQRYRVLNQLGSGGFGTVYKVQDTQLNNRLLAAKRLDLDAIAPRDHQDAINGFKQEAMILANLTHPNLPRIYEYFTSNADYFLIMDFVEGETLYEYLEKQNFPALSAIEMIKIGIQLANVLDYLHTRQRAVIFRDLKPENIMITSKNEIYLIDFGIARHFKPGQSRDTIRWATLEYAAPEQLAGLQTSAHSDIYSLGAIFHQLLSGAIPTLPSKFVPLIFSGSSQANLGRLVMRMLERDPQKRPASSAEVKQELQQILQDLQRPTRAASAKPKTAASPASKANSAPQKRPGLFQGTPLVQAARSTPPTQAIPNKSAPQTPPQPKPSVSKSRGELLHTYTQHTAAIYALAWSPDGNKLASAGADCQVCIWQALTGKTIFTYQKHTGSVHALAWSPDSKHVASASNDHTVQIWQADSGKSFSTYQEHKRWVHALAWSPNTRLIASGDASGQIHLWNPRSGQRQFIYQQHHASIHALAFSPDSTLIASADENGEIHVWESAGYSPRSIYKGHQSTISALAWSPDGALIASSSEDRRDHTLHIWQATSGTQVATYTAHQRMVNAVAWSLTNKRIASAGKDQTVQIWDPQTCNTLFTYRGHTSGINALIWSPDGSCLASADEDSAVHVWWAK